MKMVNQHTLQTKDKQESGTRTFLSVQLQFLYTIQVLAVDIII